LGCPGAIVLVALFEVSRQNFLLFHGLPNSFRGRGWLFSCWSGTRRFLNNDALVFIASVVFCRFF
jgi:hypothetical protein